MKRIAIILILAMVALIGLTSISYAEDDAQGWNLTAPFETGVTAFYFPTDSTIAGGVSETVLRIRFVDVNRPILSRLSLDLDGTLAQAVNQDKDTLYGVGFKVNYDINMYGPSGVTFEPSIGITALRNAKNISGLSDLMKDYKIALYGTIVLYRF
jgi:hypothetical protein